MASTDARPVPQKNVAYRVTFPILDADGDLVTGATSPDSEISKDGGTFADCTNEATEIATASGMYFLDLTSTEMNADTVAIIVKSGSGKTTPIVLYPEEAGDIRVNLTQILGTAVSTPATAGILDVNVKNIDNDAASASGTVTFPNATLASTVNITAAAGCAVSSIGANVITATAINADAITDAKVASDVTIASVTGAVGSVTAGVTVTTNNDKTGYGLSSAAVQAIWDALTSALTTVGSVGKKLADWTIGTAQTGDAFARLGAPAGASVSVDIAAIKSETAAIVADTNELQTDWANGGRLDVILDARASQTSVDDVPTNTELATALGTADDAVLAQVALVKTVTDKLDDTLEDDAGTFRFTASALEESPAGGTPPTVGEIADAVWDEATSGHSTAGSTGKALTDAGSAGDPWSTALPGAYGSGTAGKIVGDNINATVSSRATQTSVDDVPTNGELATALGTADDAVLSAVAALNNLSSAQAQTAAAAALTAYDPPTRAEATTDKDSIITEVNANETKIDTLQTAATTIKAKTDSLTFTVANNVDANIQRVNDVAVTGTGAVGDEWGP